MTAISRMDKVRNMIRRETVKSGGIVSLTVNIEEKQLFWHGHIQRVTGKVTKNDNELNTYGKRRKARPRWSRHEEIRQQ
jgi:hypothetical protein